MKSVRSVNVHPDAPAIGRTPRADEGVESSDVQALAHPHDRQIQSAWQLNFETLDNDIIAGSVKRLTRERGDQFGTVKPGCTNRGFTGEQNVTADATTGKRWMNKEGADAGRIMPWSEQRTFIVPSPVATEHRRALAPTAATHDLAGLLGDKVGAIANELAINAENRTQCRLHLQRRIVRRLQSANGKRNEDLQHRDVSNSCQAKWPVCVHAIGFIPPGFLSGRGRLQVNSKKRADSLALSLKQQLRKEPRRRRDSKCKAMKALKNQIKSFASEGLPANVTALTR